ncbi:MAG TPA: hypothetical protein VG983_01750 [Caulobacterales bacterium]|jgi:hypothetical protein|nr:hypothetical protein [Caulobacterales bacterium]
MAGFVSSLFSELAARRARLRAAFGDRAASWIEFALIGGIAMGALAALLMHEPRGWAPLIALIPAYAGLDALRQRALGRGGDEGETRTRYDRIAFALCAGLALIGAAICAYALQKPRSLLEEPPTNQKNYDVDIVSPS